VCQKQAFVKPITFSLLFFVIIAVQVNAQPQKAKFNYLTNRDGLSQNSGRDIIQDSIGFIWIATEMGLDKFDGYNIHSYSQNPLNSNSISNNYINALAVDYKGNILIGTDGGGLDYLDITTDSVSHFVHSPTDTNTISDNVIYAIHQDVNSYIWLGTPNGACRLDPKNKTAIRFHYQKDNPHSLSHNVIFSFAEDDQYIWVGTYSGICTIQKESLQVERITNSPRYCKSIYMKDKSELWVGSLSEGVSIINTQTKKNSSKYTKLNELNAKADNRITDIAFQGNTIWISSQDSGIFSLNLKTQVLESFRHNREIENTIGSDHIRCLFIDGGGVLWVGTQYSGVSYYNTKSKPFNHYNYDYYRKKKLSSLQAIIEDNTGDIWIGTLDGIIVYNAKNNTTKYIKHDPENNNSLCDNFVTSIIQDSDGDFWFGTNSGLSYYHPEKNLFTNFFSLPEDSNSLASSSIWGLLEDKDGLIWISTWGGGVSCYNKQTGKFTNYLHSNNKNSIPADNTHLVYEDSQGNIWIGTWEGGLSCYNKETNTFKNYIHEPKNESSLIHNTVVTLCEDKNKNIWIGTFGGGIDIFNPTTESFKHLTTETGLPSNSIMGILEDNNNNVWASTGKGLVKININNYKIWHYDISDGIQGNEFAQHGFFKTKSGKFLFSGADGFNFFHPDSIVHNLYEPQLIIEKILINGKKHFRKDEVIYKTDREISELNLAYNRNNISFFFVALHYANPEKIMYKYKLEDFDNEWIIADRSRIAKYTNIPPGEYTFMLKASNCDKIWSDNIQEIIISIAPPFWKTSWFYIISSVSLIVILILIVKLREMKLKKDKQVLEQKVKERTIEIEQQNEEIKAQRDSILEQKNHIVQQKEEIESQRDEIEAQRDLVTSQMKDIEHFNKEITDSIHYAKRIQAAILPTEEFAISLLPEHFVLYKPKDIVSGDFYWMSHVEGQTIVAVADCTGHGVPGAFMSMLGAAFLNEIVNKEYITHTGVILRRLRKEVIKSLQQKGDTNEDLSTVKDGMDMTICTIDNKEGTLQFSGANNPLYILTKDNEEVQLREIKGDKMPIAIYEKMDKFTTHTIELATEQRIYLFSDGYADQFGGPKGKKFKYKPFKQLLIDSYALPINEQHSLMEKAIDDWMMLSDEEGNKAYEQVDDITLLGIKINK